MKGIKLSERAEIDACTRDLKDLGDELERAIDAYNAATVEPKAAVEAALEAYNSRLADLREIYAGHHADASEYQGERSEKWQEGEKGQQYGSWVDSLDSIDNVDDDVTIEFPEDIPLPDMIPDWDDPSFLPADSPDEM
jgi:hypothetical protein